VQRCRVCQSCPDLFISSTVATQHTSAPISLLALPGHWRWHRPISACHGKTDECGAEPRCLQSSGANLLLMSSAIMPQNARLRVRVCSPSAVALDLRIYLSCGAPKNIPAARRVPRSNTAKSFCEFLVNRRHASMTRVRSTVSTRCSCVRSSLQQQPATIRASAGATAQSTSKKRHHWQHRQRQRRCADCHRCSVEVGACITDSAPCNQLASNRRSPPHSAQDKPKRPCCLQSKPPHPLTQKKKRRPVGCF
jgi:hypothetical protein